MEKPPKSKITAAEFNDLKAFLKKAGYKAGDLDDVLGSTISNRSRQDIAAALIIHLKKAPKA